MLPFTSGILMAVLPCFAYEGDSKSSKELVMSSITLTFFYIVSKFAFLFNNFIMSVVTSLNLYS